MPLQNFPYDLKNKECVKGVKEEVSEVIASGVDAKKISINGITEPPQGHVTLDISCIRKHPDEFFPRKSEVRIEGDVDAIVPMEKFPREHRPVNTRCDCEEQKSPNPQMTARRTAVWDGRCKLLFRSR